jgi:hypothetical protein
MSFQVLVNGALHIQTPDDNQAKQAYGHAVNRYPAADIKLVEVKVLSNRKAIQPTKIVH